MIKMKSGDSNKEIIKTGVQNSKNTKKKNSRDVTSTVISTIIWTKVTVGYHTHTVSSKSKEHTPLKLLRQSQFCLIMDQLSQR